MTLVGLTALLVGGVGIGNAVRGYLAGKTATIATLKCLGAPAELVVPPLSRADPGAGGRRHPARPRHRRAGADRPCPAHRRPAAGRGAHRPLPGAARDRRCLRRAGHRRRSRCGRSAAPASVPAASLFRDLVAPEQRRPRCCGLWRQSRRPDLLSRPSPSRPRRIAPSPAGSCSAPSATLLVFRVAASASWRRRGASAQVRRPGLRLALANLHRPGATTGSVVALARHRPHRAGRHRARSRATCSARCARRCPRRRRPISSSISSPTRSRDSTG